jgi:hypothetical protein
MEWLSAAALVVVAFLGWNLYRRFGADNIAAFVDRRRATSRMVGRGEFVDGNRHLEVALAVTDSTLFYENADMQASLDLEWVREVEYDNELATGAPVHGGKVMRLRSDSQTFEFVVPAEAIQGWTSSLPARGQLEAQ